MQLFTIGTNMLNPDGTLQLTQRESRSHLQPDHRHRIRPRLHRLDVRSALGQLRQWGINIDGSTI